MYPRSNILEAVSLAAVSLEIATPHNHPRSLFETFCRKCLYFTSRNAKICDVTACYTFYGCRKFSISTRERIRKFAFARLIREQSHAIERTHFSRFFKTIFPYSDSCVRAYFVSPATFRLENRICSTRLDEPRKKASSDCTLLLFDEYKSQLSSSHLINDIQLVARATYSRKNCTKTETRMNIYVYVYTSSSHEPIS